MCWGADVTPPKAQGWEGRKVRHGTISGYSTHRVLGEDPCDACREAKAKSSAAYNTAMRRVALEHPRVFARFYAEEKKKRGLS